MNNDGYERRILCQIGRNSNSNHSTPVKKHIYSERLMPSTLSKTTSDSIDWFSNGDFYSPDDSMEENSEYSENKVFKNLLANETVNSYPQTKTDEQKLTETTNYFRFKHERKKVFEKGHFISWNDSVLSEKSRKLLESVLKKPRKIPKSPYKTLEAPELLDDFYVNLVDWSPFDNLTVALGKVVYIWNSKTSEVTRLCEMYSHETVTSVSSSPIENSLAIATNTGRVLIYNIDEGKELYSFKPHKSRIGTLTWNNTVLASGSRDKTICLRDMRCCGMANYHSTSQTSSDCGRIFSAHKQEVCGLKFSPDGRYLASGGNDNNLFLWDIFGNTSKPSYQFTQHKAAVKALAWSPHKRGLLASGGGTADQEIRFWNSLTGQALSHHQTESQICNMVWSKNTNELVTTHGYSLNEIVVWKYPEMSQVVKLSGHTSRVLYVSLSPDGKTIVTGSGDESLRFWMIFESQDSPKRPKSVLTLDNYIR